MREIKKFKNNNLYAFIEYYYQNMLNFDFSHKHNLHKKSICLFNYFNENHLLIKPIYIQNHIKVLENYDELFKLKKILEMQIKFNSIIHESKKKSSIENKLNQLEEFTKKIQKIKQFKGYNDFNKLIDVRNFILLHNGFFDTEFKRKINIFYNLYMFLSKGKHKYLKLLKTDIEDIDFSFIADVKNKYSYSKLKDYAFYRLIRNTIIPPYNNCSFKVYKNLFKNKTQEFITYSLLGIISEGYGFAFKEYNNCKFEGDYYRYFKEILLIYLNN
jgi:hypothetical protein